MSTTDHWAPLASLVALLDGPEEIGSALAAPGGWASVFEPRSPARWRGLIAWLLSLWKRKRPTAAVLAGAIAKAQAALAQRNLERILPECLRRDVRSAPAALGSVSPRAALWGAALWIFRERGPRAVKSLAKQPEFRDPETAADCLAVHLLIEEIVASSGLEAPTKIERAATGLRTREFLDALPAMRIDAWRGEDPWVQTLLWFAGHSPLTQLVYPDVLPQPAGTAAAAVEWLPGADFKDEHWDWARWWLSLIARSLVVALASPHSAQEMAERGPGPTARKKLRDLHDNSVKSEMGSHYAARGALLTQLGGGERSALLYGRFWDLLVRRAVTTASPRIVASRGRGDAEILAVLTSEIASAIRGASSIPLSLALQRCQSPFASMNRSAGEIEAAFRSKLPLPLAERETDRIRTLLGYVESVLSRAEA